MLLTLFPMPLERGPKHQIKEIQQQKAGTTQPLNYPKCILENGEDVHLIRQEHHRSRPIKLLLLLTADTQCRNKYWCHTYHYPKYESFGFLDFFWFKVEIQIW